LARSSHPGFGAVDLVIASKRNHIPRAHAHTHLLELTVSLKPLLGLAVIAALVAGCGQASSGETSVAKSTSAYPVKLTNCGFDVTVDKPPKRVVTIKSTSIELLLALGLGDKIVGKAFLDGPVPAKWSAEAARIPTLSAQVPSQEVLLASEPDLVFAGWESNLAAGSGSERPDLQKLGIATYVSPAACKEPRFQPKKMTFDLLFDQFTQIGRIFGVQDRAKALIAQQKKQLAAVQKVKPGTTALWYSSGTSVPYVGAGIGAPQMVMSHVGLTNIAAGVRDTWTSMSWEKIAADNPDVIILVDATWNTAAKKIKDLKSSPVTRTMDAVRHDRFITIPFPASEAGVRSVSATVELSKKLAALGYGK